MSIKLTAYSHGAGCGCKLSPAVLDEILQGAEKRQFKNLLIGNERKDDAAVYQIDDQTSVVSTTDFFMPIVDDPFDFGSIAATNAISDIYAMGATPLMAIAILGWPIDTVPVSVAREVLKGGRTVCHRAGIPLAGGHSIDAPEPIFGLAVTGKILTKNIKSNESAHPNDLIYLTKPLGIGLVTTAQKKGVATTEDLAIATGSMLQLNRIGSEVAHLPFVHAMTDVTGFGLAGHLLEVLEASRCAAQIRHHQIPQLPFVNKYLELKTIPGGTGRNWESYHSKIVLTDGLTDYRLIADPQTSGGLLIFVDPTYQDEFESQVRQPGHEISLIGNTMEGKPMLHVMI